MAINLNRQPYFDDFDKNKNFVKILFKPSRPVQVRELNQIQSIQKNQLELFANHIFKDGSKIEGRPPAKTKVDYITVELPINYINRLAVNNKLIAGGLLRGESSGVEAQIIVVSKEITGISPTTIYLTYTRTGTNGTDYLFYSGETIYVLDGTIENSDLTVTVRTDEETINYLNYPARGKGIIWKIEESIYYARGYFIEILPSIIVGEAYEIGTESYSIGFDVEEIIVDVDDPIFGSELYDNALGYPNYSAPGADRLKINLTLAKRSIDSIQNENFIILAKIEDGITTYVKSRSDYATIMETLAERTYDESGNYTVLPIKIKFRDHQKKDIYDTYGMFLPQGENEEDGTRIFGDENKFVAIISPIKSYIKGFLVEKIAESKIVLDKARDLGQIDEFYDRVGTLNYFLIELAADSAFSHNQVGDRGIFNNTLVNLYDTVPETNGDHGIGGSDIGTVKIHNIEKHATNTYRVYFSELTLDDGHTIDELNAIWFNDSVGGAIDFNAKVITPFSIYNPEKRTLIHELPKSNVYSLKDIDNNQLGLDFTVRRCLSSTLVAITDPFVGYSVTFTLSGDEIFDDYNADSSFLYVLADTGRTEEILTFSNSDYSNENKTLKVNWETATSSLEGSNVFLYQNVIKTNSQPKLKFFSNFTHTTTYIKNTVITDPLISVPAKTDLIYLNVLTLSYNGTTTEVDLANITVFNGVTDTSYVPITFTLSADLLADINNKLSNNDSNVVLAFDFYYYSRTTSGEYFSIDSYRNIIDNTSIIYGYEDVPTYLDLNGKTYKLSDCLDFRPDLLTSARITNISSPEVNSIFNTDLTYYLPRVDYIVIDKNGAIYQKKGASSETPKPPVLSKDDSEMAIMLLKLKPYVYDVQTDIIKKYIDNKRYTMRDIGRLEKRIENLEYYTSFTLLEMQTETASIKDENGLDRYKNGFIAENFTDFLIADISNPEFKAAHDTGHQDLRPAAFPYNTNLYFDETNSANWLRIGDKIIIDFDEESFITQPFSSKSISLNPYFVFEKRGTMVLYPDTDNWVDTTRLPELSVTIDTNINSLIPAEPIIETYWDSWRTFSETNIASSVTTTDIINLNNSRRALETTTIDTTITAASQQRSGIEVTTTYDTRIDQQDLGDRVTDVELMTYARETFTIFAAGGLKPNTNLYAFFDDIPVSEYCCPFLIDANLGDQLKSDSFGNIKGIFVIPGNTFFTGQKIFRLTNEINDDRDQDALLTSAESKFWSGGLSLEKQNTTLNVNTFDINVFDEELTQNRVTVDVTTNTTVTRELLPAPPPPSDPLAQTFYNENSCFITGIDLFFETVGINDRVWVQLKNVENGYPGSMILGETIIHARDITVSNDASVTTRINFPFPLFIPGGKEYAMVVGSFSPDTRIFCSLLGKYDLTHTDQLIDTQPSLGSLFKGQNNSTWTASQYEDMKIFIYRAIFKYDSLFVVLKNELSNEFIEQVNPFETETGESKVRVYARNHGMSIGDKIQFFINENVEIRLVGRLGGDYDLVKNLSIGQQIYSFSTAGDAVNNNNRIGSATIKSITMDEYDIGGGVMKPMAKCILTDVIGKFTKVGGLQVIKCITYDLEIDSRYDDELILILGDPSGLNDPNATPTYSDRLTQGEVLFDIVDILSEDGISFLAEKIPETIHGINVSELNSNLLTVDAVDSIDTFIIDPFPTGSASATGRCGGTCKFPINRRFELFNVNGAYSAIDCEEAWTFYGVGHGINDLFTDANGNRLYGKAFTPYANTFLKQPNKFASGLNETADNKNIIIIGEFTTNTNYVSPVLDISTFNSILVSNRVDFIDQADIDIAPSASGRFKAETVPWMGSEVFKYISKNITLLNPALDLKIFLDVYQPIYTDFDIYVKVQPTWDYGTIDEKDWIKLDPIWKDFISRDLTDYREIQVVTNEIMPGTFGIAGSQGEFSSFKIKIVGRARNPANPPLFRKLRAIAIT